MSFFAKAFRAPKKDGQQLLTELLDHACSNANAITAHSTMTTVLADSDQEFTAIENRQHLASCYVAFIDDALEFGKAATDALGLLTDRKVDVTAMHEVEFLTLVTAVDALLLAKWTAEELAAEPDHMAAAESLEFNADDPRRLKKNDIISFGEFAQEVRFQRGLGAPDYASRYLPLVRARLPDGVRERGFRLWAQMKA